MKKILAIIPTLALVFAFSTSFAFASDRNNSCCNDSHDKKVTCCPSVEIENTNDAKTYNNVTSFSDTGLNKILSSFGKKTHSSRHHDEDNGLTGIAKILSGAAESFAGTETYANDTRIVVDEPEKGKVEIENTNEALTTNNVTSSASTGYNFISAKGIKSVIKTGYAGSQSSAITMVNSNVIKITD
ncbi:MAG: hypothetical protein US70_C0001G0001 [Parcubacteria group bacterium GW2011_GWD2_38_11]|nr:MAG: hypothetical protein US70_C0001G0001 [Parcubacteria group bacterium GW2011_GWD2_38_11]